MHSAARQVSSPPKISSADTHRQGSWGRGRSHLHTVLGWFSFLQTFLYVFCLDPSASRRDRTEPFSRLWIWSTYTGRESYPVLTGAENWVVREILGRIFNHFGAEREARTQFYIETLRRLKTENVFPCQDLMRSIQANKFGENVEFNQFRTSRWSPTHSRYFALLRSSDPGTPRHPPAPQLTHTSTPTHTPHKLFTKLLPSASPQIIFIVFFF